MDQLADFLASPSGLAVKGLLLGTFLTFALGVVAAFRDGTFAWTYIDSFVRSTVWGRVMPVAVVLAAGYVADEATVTAAGVAAAGVVAAGMVASALASIAQLGKSREESAEANSPPTA